MILDIDDFKRVNDVLGHLQGDMVLVGVADAIRRIFRKGDILGRFGGDEFIIFMPGVKEEALAGKKARSILKEVSR
ncbi:GGDEF domain-containing protein, partial [Acinetobacter baumannii]|nr:GGDEF domain-containing protein [Acinetobacter baumannii]